MIVLKGGEWCEVAGRVGTGLSPMLYPLYSSVQPKNGSFSLVLFKIPGLLNAIL